MEEQEHAHWCWAAVGNAVRAVMDSTRTLTQCAVATRVMEREFSLGFGRKPVDCCKDFAPSNEAKSLNLTLEALGHLQDPARPGGVASFALIQSEIEAGRPVAARIVWDPDDDDLEDGAHFVLIVGWDCSQGPDKVLVLDSTDWLDARAVDRLRRAQKGLRHGRQVGEHVLRQIGERIC